MKKFDKNYWQQRWDKAETGWDIGYASPPITEYIDQIKNKDLKILIPGCGNAHEGEYLIDKGFNNTFLIDIAPGAFANLKKRFPDFPDENLILGDFFEHNDTYDLIFEQTFFCALAPDLRRKYAEKMHNLLRENGKLAGVLFNEPLFQDHPPFGGSKPEYLPYFEDLFKIIHFEEAYNSIRPRSKRELFIELEKMG